MVLAGVPLVSCNVLPFKSPHLNYVGATCGPRTSSSGSAWELVKITIARIRSHSVLLNENQGWGWVACIYVRGSPGHSY